MSVEIIKSVVDSVPGMISIDEGLFLYKLASQCSKGAIVEIGSNAGRSTICLAKGSQLGGKMRVYSVDPHNGGGATPDPTWYDAGDPGTPDKQYYVNQGVCFNTFQERLKQHGVDDIVIPLVNYSELAYKKGWDKHIELLFIDADHRYNYVKMDMELWGKHLIPGGTILMHDSTYTGVRKVINEMIISNPRFTDIRETPIFSAKVTHDI
ncbi:MAG: class I SAM-dependent methyltransferase [Flavobacteriaceae bacterium]|nr:class I SAM-dependent methyltransferase [Flavobacteriaceae bacterium]